MNEKKASRFNLIENTRTFDVSAFVSAYHFHSQPWKRPLWEQYEFSQILLIVEGTGIYTTKDASYPIRPGMMIYRPAHQQSVYDLTSSQKIDYALVSFVCDSDAMKVFEKTPFTLYEEERATLLEVMNTGARICESIHDDENLMGMRLKQGVPNVVLNYISSSLERFLSMVYCRLTNIELLVDESQKVSRYIRDSQLVAQVRAYMVEHISEKLTIADLCEHFWLSQTALTQKFRNETGRGLMEYFSDLKVAEAKRRIAGSTESFTNISESLGFSSINYFSKVFKGKTGMTPTEYSRFCSKRRAATTLQIKDEVK